MILVIAQTERTESSIHAVQAIHIAFALVRVSMQLALNKEALPQQWFQPWRPPVVFLIRTPSTLFGFRENKKASIKPNSINQHKKAIIKNGQNPISLTMILLLLGLISRTADS